MKWFKPGKAVFKIHYGHEATEYESDFVVETETAKFLCEPKRENQMRDPEVLAKAEAAATWCHHASEHAKLCGGKPWSYLLIPHHVIADNKTLQGLAATYTIVQHPAKASGPGQTSTAP